MCVRTTEWYTMEGGTLHTVLPRVGYTGDLESEGSEIFYRFKEMFNGSESVSQYRCLLPDSVPQ